MKSIRIAHLLLAAALVAAPAFAQNTTTVTATTIYSGAVAGSATPLASGTLCLTGVDQYANPINFTQGGGGLNLANRPFCQTVTAGALAGSLVVPNPAHTLPANICYVLAVTDASTQQVIQLGKTCAIGGSSYSLDTANFGGSTYQPATNWTAGNGAPSGACVDPSFYIQEDAGGKVWDCPGGTWTAAPSSYTLTATAMGTAVAGQSGCATSGYAWSPATDTCVAVGGGGISPTPSTSQSIAQPAGTTFTLDRAIYDSNGNVASPGALVGVNTPWSARYGVACFGDSNTAGFGLQSGEQDYCQQINAAYNPSPTANYNDYGISGDTCEDVSYFIFDYLNPSDSVNPFVSAHCGTNNFNFGSGSSVGLPTYTELLASGVSWGALSSRYKFPANLTTTTGTWTANTDFSSTTGETSTTNGSTITWSSYTYTDGVALLYYKIINHTSFAGGTFTCAIDGTTATDTITSSSTLYEVPPNNLLRTTSAPSSVGLAIFPVTVGAHVLSCTVTSATNTNNAVTLYAQAVPPSTPQSGITAPRVALDGVIATQNYCCGGDSPSGALSAQFDGYNQSVAALLQSYGLQVVFVPVRKYVNNSVDMQGLAAQITAYSVTSNVATFTTNTQALLAGQNVQISAFAGSGNIFNGANLIVLSTGLTTTQFEAAFTHANASGTDNGYVTLQNGSFNSSNGYHMTGPGGHTHAAEAIAAYSDLVSSAVSSPNHVPGVISSYGSVAPTSLANFGNLVGGTGGSTTNGGGYNLGSGVLWGWLQDNAVPSAYSGYTKGGGWWFYGNGTRSGSLADPTCWESSYSGDSSLVCRFYKLADGTFIHGAIVSDATGSSHMFSVSGCTPLVPHGGDSAGRFNIGQSGTGSCTVTITMGDGITASDGWHCSMDDETTPFHFTQTGHSTTGATLTGTVTYADQVTFNCVGWNYN